MIRNHVVLALFTLVASGAPGVAVAQETPPEIERPPVSRGADVDAKIRTWIEQLGADEHAQRLDAERALREQGEGARAALEKAVAESDDPEVRWRARRVLRALDGNPPALERRPNPADPGQAENLEPNRPRLDQDPERRIEELLQRLEQSFGQDFGVLRGFDDVQRQLEEMRQQMSEMDRRFGAQGLHLDGAPQQMQLQIGPDGVRLEVREPDAQGKPQSKTYEAESLEAFREKYPDLAKRYLDGGVQAPLGGIGTRPWFGRDRPFGGGRLLRPGPGGTDDQPVEIIPPAEPTAPPPEGERLGIFVGELAPAVREFLGIEPGLGLLVNSVEPGSLAEALGLQPRDILLKIGGRPVLDTADVRAALRGIDKGQQVEVVVNRLGKSLEFHAEKVHAAPPDSRKLRSRGAEPDAGSGGERRR